MEYIKNEWTIKEVAEECNISKTSVNRAIKELNIKTELTGNKKIVKLNDVKRIVLKCCGRVLNCSETETEQNTAEQIETNQGSSATNQTKTEQTETATEQTETANIQPDKTAFFDNSDFKLNENENLISFLMEQIKEKDLQIANLQEQNKLLIQSQAYTIKQIELLTKEPEETENDIAQPQKKRWWQRKR